MKNPRKHFTTKCFLGKLHIKMKTGLLPIATSLTRLHEATSGQHRMEGMAGRNWMKA
jgi:hypothetical protein